MDREFKIALSQEYYSDIVYLSQYDTDYNLVFTVMDKYANASGIDGYTAKFTGTRNDTLGFTFESVAVGNTVSFEINTSLTAVSGTHKGEIVFYDTDGLYFGTANVQIIVEPAARPDGTIDADVERAQEIAEQVEELIDGATEGAEAWAVGQRGGVDVESTDETYHNNAKYYAEQAQDIAYSIGIDATLTQAGKAADAKATGDEISALNTHLSNRFEIALDGVSVDYYQTSASGTIVKVLDIPIPAGVTISISNDSDDTTFVIILIDEDRGVHNLGTSGAGYTRITTQDKPIVEVRYAITSGSTLDSTVTYGEAVSERINNDENDITDIKNTALINGNIHVGAWQNKNYMSGSWATSLTIISSEAIKAEKDIIIDCTADYMFGINKWTSTIMINANYLSASGWIESGNVYLIKAGEIFNLFLKRVDEGNINVSEGTNIRLETTLKKTYEYTMSGEKINFDVPKYHVSTLNNIRSTPASQITPSVTEVQGTAFYNNKVFQLYSNDVLLVIDYLSNAKTQLSITCGHGNTCDFSDEFYDDADDFPLFYASAGTNPAVVYVNRVNMSGTQLVRTLTFPIDKTGYYANHCIDNTNKILYQIGYRQNSFNVDTDNALIVTKWDLNNLTDNGDNTFAPAFVSSFEIPYYTTIQGVTFFNGKIIAISSGWTSIHTKIIFIDVSKQLITSIIDSFPSAIQGVETEGVALVPDNEKYFMLIKTANVFFYRIDFS